MRDQRTSQCDAGMKRTVKSQLDLSKTDGFEYGGQCYVYTTSTGHEFQLRHRPGLGWKVKCEALEIDEIIPSETSHEEIKQRLEDLTSVYTTSTGHTFKLRFDHATGWEVKCEVLDISEVIPSETDPKEIQRRLNDLAKMVYGNQPKPFIVDFDILAAKTASIIKEKQQWPTSDFVTVMEGDGQEFYLRNTGKWLALNHFKDGESTPFRQAGFYDYNTRLWTPSVDLGVNSPHKMVPTAWSNWAAAVSKHL